MHDSELPALKTEQDCNNMVKMRPSSSGGGSSNMVIVKQPKADNLKKGIAELVFAAKNVSKAVVESGLESAEASKDPRGEVVGIRYGIQIFGSVCIFCNSVKLQLPTHVHKKYG